MSPGHSAAKELDAEAASRRIRLMDETDGTWPGSHSRWLSKASRISEANSDGLSLLSRNTLRTTLGVAIYFYDKKKGIKTIFFCLFSKL